MNYKELNIEDFNNGDIWMKKDGHKMIVTDKTSNSVEFKLFVHKSSDNVKNGIIGVKHWFKHWFRMDDIANKRSVLEGYKKSKV